MTNAPDAFWPVLLSVAWLGWGCASTPPPSGDEGTSSAAEQTTPRYGGDPMGTARRWVDEHVASGADGPALLDELESPVVARLYRADTTRYRAVIAEPESRGDDPAILLTIEPNETGTWRVVEVTSGGATHLWTEM